MTGEITLMSVWSNHRTEITAIASACLIASSPYIVSLIKIAWQNFVKNRIENQIKKHILAEAETLYNEYTLPKKKENEAAGLGFILTDEQKVEAKALAVKAAKARISEADRALAKQYLGNIDDYVDIQMEVAYQVIKSKSAVSVCQQESK